MDCIFSELKDVDDLSLIQYVSEAIGKQEIRSIYQSFCEQDEMCFSKEDSDQDKNDTYQTECEEMDDTLMSRHTIGGQKEKDKEKQQQKDFPLTCESHSDNENPLRI